MSRTRRFLDGLAYGYLNQAVLILVGLWLVPFLLAHLGQEDYGLWLVAAQILSYLLLADLGVVGLLPRETAFEVGRASRAESDGPETADGLPELVGRTLRLVLWQMPLVAAAALAIWWLLPAEWAPLSGPLGWLLVAFVLLFPARLFTAVLQGIQDLRFLGRAQLVAWSAGTAVTVGLVFAGAGLYALIGGWITQQGLGAALQLFRLRREHPELVPRTLPRLERGWARRYLGKGVWLSVGQVAQVLLNSTDVLILGAVLGPAWVVPYACTGKLIMVLANQPQMVMQTAIPALSELRYAESRQRVAQVSRSLTLAMLLASGGVAVVVIAVNRGFVLWWVGSEQWAGLTLTVLLLANMLLRHWNTTAVFSIFCFGYERWISLVMLADGAVTVGVSVLLVRELGWIGAPLGALAGVAISLPLNLTALGRETGGSLGGQALALGPWLWRFALAAAAAVAVARLWAPEGIVEVALAAAAMGLGYGLLMLPLVLRPPLGDYVRPRLASLRRRLTRRAPGDLAP